MVKKEKRKAPLTEGPTLMRGPRSSNRKPMKPPPSPTPDSTVLNKNKQ